MFSIESWVYGHFQDVIAYGQPVTDLRVDCPFCINRYGKVDAEKKLYISLRKRACHCFRCGYSKSWIGLVMDTTGLSYAQALGELYTVPKARDFADVKQKFVVSVPNGRKHFCQPESQVPEDFIPLHGKVSGISLVDGARKYLRGRGFDMYYWHRYNLGVAESIGWRVIIPVEEDFWQARAVFPFVQPKYMSPKMEARHVIFNWIALEMYDEVVICEGAFSAMVIGENAIGLLRKKATAEQIERLLQSNVTKFNVALDSDANLEAAELASLLDRGGKNISIWHYDKGDPADDNAVHTDKNYEFKLLVEARLG